MENCIPPKEVLGCSEWNKGRGSTGILDMSEKILEVATEMAPGPQQSDKTGNRSDFCHLFCQFRGVGKSSFQGPHCKISTIWRSWGVGLKPCVYRGNTKKPEKVEYFQPPMRLPLSSLRCTLSSLSISSRTPLLAASLVTSWSPAKAEITG